MRKVERVSEGAPEVSIEPGTLYVVATPIGNLGDLSPRARAVLAGVGRVVAEDTRVTGALLRRLGLATPLVSLHAHNEARRVPELLAALRAGEALALVSDAGTPLVSDPGRRLVAAAGEAGLEVVAVPGPSAVTAALSVAGLPAERFVFEGFLPAKAAGRRARLGTLRGERRTLVFFEAPHRLAESLADMAGTLGRERRAVVARELTKRHETVLRGTLEALAARVAAEADQRRGEAVVVVSGAEAPPAPDEAEARRVLAVLLQRLPPREAARAAAEITGLPRNRLYRWAVEKDGR